MSTNELVLVTGGSGFVGSHCVLAALQHGYRVRTTVRLLKRADEVRQMILAGGATQEQADSIEFCAVDLLKDDGWDDACKECKYVLHVASPFPPSSPKHEDDLIVPARDGTLRALKAAKAAGTVKRVVITSSFAAIGYGHPQRGKDKPFTEKDWTILEKPAHTVPAYPKSKTIAERAAWDWMAREGQGMELATVNPVGICGPLLSKSYATSVELVVRLMNGALPGVPQLVFGIVDVRDVADLHLRAMTDSKAKGERFLAVSGEFVDIHEIALILKKRLGHKARKVPTRKLPDILLRIVAIFDPTVAMIVPELGNWKSASSEKAMSVLDWHPRSVEDAIEASAESLEKFGLLKD